MWKLNDIGWGILCLIEGIGVFILGIWISIVGFILKILKGSK